MGLRYASANSLIRAEHRRPLNAIVLAGAGAAYLSGGFGPWELVFTTAMTYVAYRGCTHGGGSGRLAAAHRPGCTAAPLRQSHSAVRSQLMARLRDLRPSIDPVVFRRGSFRADHAAPLDPEIPSDRPGGWRPAGTAAQR